MYDEASIAVKAFVDKFACMTFAILKPELTKWTSQNSLRLINVISFTFIHADYLPATEIK